MLEFPNSGPFKFSDVSNIVQSGSARNMFGAGISEHFDILSYIGEMSSENENLYQKFDAPHALSEMSNMQVAPGLGYDMPTYDFLYLDMSRWRLLFPNNPVVFPYVQESGAGTKQYEFLAETFNYRPSSLSNLGSWIPWKATIYENAVYPKHFGRPYFRQNSETFDPTTYSPPGGGSYLSTYNISPSTQTIFGTQFNSTFPQGYSRSHSMSGISRLDSFYSTNSFNVYSSSTSISYVIPTVNNYCTLHVELDHPTNYGILPDGSNYKIVDENLNTITNGTFSQMKDYWSDHYNEKNARYRFANCFNSSWVHLLRYDNENDLGFNNLETYTTYMAYEPGYSTIDVAAGEWPDFSALPSRGTSKLFVLQDKLKLNDFLNKETKEFALSEINKAIDKLNNTINGDFEIEVIVSHTRSEPEEGGTLGAAGPFDSMFKGLEKGGNYYQRPSMVNLFFDSIDLIDSFNVVRNGNTDLYYLTLHELLHGLGIGTWWDGAAGYDYGGYYENLTTINSYGTQYTGPNGIREYKAALNVKFGSNHGYYDSYVPAQGGGGGHIAEYAKISSSTIQPSFPNEIMTPLYEFNSNGSIFSRITLGLLEDLGYSVNYSQADSTNELIGSTDTSYQYSWSTYDQLNTSKIRSCGCRMHK